MKYALITGASRGLGRAIAIKLSALGNPVIINYLSNEAAANATKNEVEANGGIAELLQFDTSNPQETEEKLGKWEEAHPDDYISVLVNNAGIRRDNMMFMMGDDDWHRVLDTTLNGFFYKGLRLHSNISPNTWRESQVARCCRRRAMPVIQRNCSRTKAKDSLVQDTSIVPICKSY